MIRQKLSVKLNKIEQYLYDKCFKTLMDKHTFKVIIDSASFSHVASDNFVFQQNNCSTGVYLVVHLNKAHQLAIIVNNEVVDIVIQPFSWFGLIEYDILNKQKQHSSQTSSQNWTSSLKLEKKMKVSSNTSDSESEKTNETFKDHNQPLYVYFFKFEDLDKLYKREDGTFIRNALHSAWLENLALKIQNIDRKVKKIKSHLSKEVCLSDLASEGTNKGSINEPLLVN